MKPHVVAHDVELNDTGALVTFDPVGVEQHGVTQLVAHRQGETETVLLAEAIQQVEDRAAGRLVRLQEHDVGAGPTGAQRGALRLRGGEECVRLRLDAAEHEEERERETEGESVKSGRNRDASSVILVCGELVRCKVVWTSINTGT